MNSPASLLLSSPSHSRLPIPTKSILRSRPSLGLASIASKPAGLSSYQNHADNLYPGEVEQYGTPRQRSESFDSASDTSSHLDSILDAYADMYPEQGQGSEDEEEEEVEQQEEEQEQEKEQEETPWDTRGKTGLFGGGGRGANDAETGWLEEYQPLRRDRLLSDDSAYSAAEAPILRTNGKGREEVPTVESVKVPASAFSAEHSRDASSGSDYSAEGPLTPIASTFPPIHVGLPSSLGLHTPIRNSSDFKPSLSPPPLNQRSITSPPLAASETTPLSLMQSRNSTTLDSTRVNKRPSASPNRTTLGSPIPLRDDRPPILVAVEESPIVKKDTAGFRWRSSKSKKKVLISDPILPEGFVESLGMSTFPLPQAGAHQATQADVVAHREAIADKKVKSAPTQSSLLPAHPIDTPVAITTSTSSKSLEGLRQVDETTPPLPSFHAEIDAAFKTRRSEDSVYSQQGGSSLGSGAHGRQNYFASVKRGSGSIPEPISYSQSSGIRRVDASPTSMTVSSGHKTVSPSSSIGLFVETSKPMNPNRFGIQRPSPVIADDLPSVTPILGEGRGRGEEERFYERKYSGPSEHSSSQDTTARYSDMAVRRGDSRALSNASNASEYSSVSDSVPRRQGSDPVLPPVEPLFASSASYADRTPSYSTRNLPPSQRSSDFSSYKPSSASSSPRQSIASTEVPRPPPLLLSRRPSHAYRKSALQPRAPEGRNSTPTIGTGGFRSTFGAGGIVEGDGEDN